MRVNHRRRNTAAALGIALLVSVGLLAVGTAPAGAQTTTPETPCLYTVSPTTLPPGGGTVTVKGSAPGSSIIRVYADGIFITAVETNLIDGTFEVSFPLNQTSEIAITIDDYPATGCTVDTANQGANQGRGSSSLPRTGSDHVETTVLLALFLVAIGAVLVVAVRRHDQVNGRLRSKRH